MAKQASGCASAIFGSVNVRANYRKEDFMEQRAPSDYEVLREQLQSVLSMLAPLEQDVLRMRFGLDDGKCNTIKEVCDHFGMTRTEVQVVEVKALRRLREVGK